MHHYSHQGLQPPFDFSPRHPLELYGDQLTSSSNGEVAGPVIPPSPFAGGPNVGAPRKALPPTVGFVPPAGGVLIDPQLTAGLSDRLHNEVVDVLTCQNLTQTEWEDVGGGRHEIGYVATGSFGMAAVTLRIEKGLSRRKLLAMSIVFEDSRMLSAPARPTSLRGDPVTIPLEVMEDYPWLEGLLSDSGWRCVDDQTDPQQPQVRTMNLHCHAASKVELKLCRTPDDTYQVEEVHARVEHQGPPPRGFSYARAAILARYKSTPSRYMQFEELTGLQRENDPAAFERAIEAARDVGQSHQWTPDPIDAKRWYTRVDVDGISITLPITFDDDALTHVVDVQRYRPGEEPKRFSTGGRYFEHWDAKQHRAQPRRNEAQRLFEGAVLDEWVKINPTRDRGAILDDALAACAEIESDADLPTRSDGKPVARHALASGPDSYFYQYDTVLGGKDVSLILEFTHPNRRVWKAMDIVRPVDGD